MTIYEDCVYLSHIGWVCVKANDDAVFEVSFCEQKTTSKGNKHTRQCIQELIEYMEGKRTIFEVPIVFIKGTDFQQRCWKALLQIPYGETISYQELALMVNSPKAVRAVGGANHHNPICIIVPCHRVIGKNGKLVGYGGGLDKKEYLLNLEGV